MNFCDQKLHADRFSERIKNFSNASFNLGALLSGTDRFNMKCKANIIL